MDKNILIDEMKGLVLSLLKDFETSYGKNVASNRRCRLKLVKLEKIGKKFRRASVDLEKNWKEDK